jgi:hypothetical protein
MTLEYNIANDQGFKITVCWEMSQCNLVYTDVSENLKPSSSGYSEDVIAGAFKILVLIYQATRRHIQEDPKLNIYLHCEKFKYHTGNDLQEITRGPLKGVITD